MNRRAWILLAACVFGALASDAFAATIYNNGMTHVINFPSEPIVVLDREEPTSAGTTAILVPGGLIQTVTPPPRGSSGAGARKFIEVRAGRR
jgi:hypothetical protein